MNRLCIPLNGISILVLVPLLFVTGRIFGQKLCAVQTRDLPCFLTRSKICKFIRVEFPRGGGRVDKWTLSDDGRLISLFPDNQTRSSVRSIVIYDLRREQRKGQWYNEIIIIDYGKFIRDFYSSLYLRLSILFFPDVTFFPTKIPDAAKSRFESHDVSSLVFFPSSLFFFGTHKEQFRRWNGTLSPLER